MTESINADPTRTPLPSPRPGLTPPPGYTETPLWDPFEAFVGPLFDRREARADGTQELSMAFYVDERHLNGRDVVHGGMLMTFADAVLGSAAWNATGRTPCVTLSMQTSFLGPARMGDLVECKPEITRKARSVIFVRGTFTVAGNPIMTAASLWKVLGR
jgi:uncharacterized protein (TIGR00369 family)